MKSFFLKFIFLFSILLLGGCKQNSANSVVSKSTAKNEIQHAKGLEIYHYQGYSILNITHPWPGAKTPFTYILQEKNGSIPDSLQQYTRISVPIQSIVVTSTTHIPALELLGV